MFMKFPLLNASAISTSFLPDGVECALKKMIQIVGLVTKLFEPGRKKLELTKNSNFSALWKLKTADPGLFELKIFVP